MIAALFDDDQMRGVSSSTYLQKSAALLRDSIGCAITSQQNDIDRRIRLVLTGEGPVYRSLSSLGTTFNVRRARNLYYEQSFADLVLQEMVLCNAKCKAAKSRISAILAGRGVRLLSLLPTATAHWWPLIEDVFSSPPAQEQKKAMLGYFSDQREFESISIDATVKCCMSVMGQESYRCSSAKRNSAPFGDDTAYRRVLTVRGRTSAVLAMSAIQTERAEDVRAALADALPPAGLQQVQCVAADNASLKLYTELVRIMPNLHALCLDPIHLSIVYERLGFQE